MRANRDHTLVEEPLLDIGQIDINHLLRKAKQAGFESIEDFVKANLNYLPKWKQELFCFLEKFQ